MVKILENIIEKRADMIDVPKAMPEIIGEPGNETIIYDGLKIPKQLNRKFLNKCGIALKSSEKSLTDIDVAYKIYKTNQEKDLFLRIAGDKPLSVVTSKFNEISPSQIAQCASDLLGTNPIVRYFRNNESMQFNYPIDSRFKGLNVVMDTGRYGTYGGSGENAIKFGLTWFNKICSNWTMFLDDLLEENFGRVIHMGDDDFSDRLYNVIDLANNLDMKIDESKDNNFDYPELDSYLSAYEARGLNKKIADQIREESPMNVYDISYRLTELCQDEKLSDTSRARIEYIAGELILCYDKIKKNVIERPLSFAPRKKQSYNTGKLNYVSMN